MKKIVSILLCLVLSAALIGCGSTDNNSSLSDTATQKNTQAEERDELEKIGDVEVENGILFVKVTMPADYVGEMTQEQLDESAGEGYTSATLEEDGSVTYKMTKSQHKTMLKETEKSFEESLQMIIDDNENYTISAIKHNKDFTVFDVTLDGSEIGFGDFYCSYVFFICGGMWGIFSGQKNPEVTVNFYDSANSLIDSYNSNDLAE